MPYVVRYMGVYPPGLDALLQKDRKGGAWRPTTRDNNFHGQSRWVALFVGSGPDCKRYLNKIGHTRRDNIRLLKEPQVNDPWCVDKEVYVPESGDVVCTTKYGQLAVYQDGRDSEGRRPRPPKEA